MALAIHLCSISLISLDCDPFRAYPLKDYPAVTKHGAAIMLMIMNNLDRAVAQFPHELITYGGNGQVFSNWAQVKK